MCRRRGDEAAPAGLTELGRAQARALGRRLVHEGIRFDRIYASTLPRALETAELVVAELGADDGFEPVADLIEWREGDWSGMASEQIFTDKLITYMKTKGYLFVPPGGESLRMVQRRVSTWLEDTILYNEAFLDRPQRILMVCHGLVIRTLLQYALGFYPGMIKRLGCGNTSITELAFDHEGWHLERLNDTAHLADVEAVR